MTGLREEYESRIAVKQLPLYVVWVLYIAAVPLLAPMYQHRINPDETAYFSIATKYVRGDLFEAISGHWPPLFVWLIALGLKAGLTALTAVNVIDTAAGLLLLWSSDRLASMLGIRALLRAPMLVIVGLYSLLFMFLEVRTDFLLVSILTLYISQVTDPSYPTGSVRPWAAGAVAGIAYYAKPYALFFVLAHLALVTTFDCWSVRRFSIQAIRRAGIVAVTMLAVAAPWIACISWKYGRFTVSTAADQHFRQGSPSNDPEVVNVGLAALPNSTAFNYWEEPTRLNLPPWSPWSSIKDLEFYMNSIENNIVALVFWILHLSVAAPFVFSVLVFERFRTTFDRTKAILISAIITYTSGYCLLSVIDRYMWPVAIWLIVLMFSMRLSERRPLIATLLALSFLPHPISGLMAWKNQGDAEYQIGQTLKTRLGLKGSVAASSEWLRSLYVCYFAGLPFYGVTAPGSAEDIREQLDHYHIQYLFVWKNQTLPPHLLDGMQRIDNTPADVQIYTPRRDSR